MLSFLITEYTELSQPGVVILLYHKIKPQGGSDKYTVTLENFEKQLNHLYSEGYRTILPKEIIENDIKYNLEKTIILSFDDGTEDHFNIVYPILKNFHFKGIFFVIAKSVDFSGRLKSDQIRDMSENGMEIGSHSYSHPLLDSLNADVVYDELKRSKDQLQKICGCNVYSLAPPGGWFNNETLKIGKSVGYNSIFGCEIGTNDLRKKNYVYKRIEVLSDMQLDDFQQLLTPRKVLRYKVMQTLKFYMHSLLGSKNYEKLSSLVN